MSLSVAHDLRSNVLHSLDLQPGVPGLSVVLEINAATHISMKKYSSVVASIMNSTVPAPTLFVNADPAIGLVARGDNPLVDGLGSSYRFLRKVLLELGAQSRGRSFLDDL